jgi:hypothetical protein
MTGAVRTRRWRDRQARGIRAIVQVEVTENLVQHLISDGWLSATKEGDNVTVKRDSIEPAINAMLTKWSAS